MLVAAIHTHLLSMMVLMTLPIGSQILEHRRRLGWEQADLAQRLQAPVSQQTVSRWESGRSRPRRAVVVELAELFGVDPTELLRAAGYTNAADQAHVVPKPLQPRLTVLPVWELPPDKFEELTADIAQHLRPDTFVSRLGGQGHKQCGADVVAEKDSRYVLAYQCKRHKDFGPRDVRETVAKATLASDAHFLVLSRRSASPEARREMQRHPGWTLWDAEDLSRMVRGLPLDRSVRIIDTYFPGWREPFLGVAEPGPWLDTDDFFLPLTSTAVYNHDWTLVGRDKEMEEILAFLNDPSQRMGLLIGRGGIGKSKLLREVVRRARRQDLSVRFLKPAAVLKPEDYDLLPTDVPLLIVVDDAHDREDMAVAAADMLRDRPRLKVLLSLRPYGIDLLAADLRTVGVRISDLPQFVLSDLPRAAAETLAVEALGPGWPRQLGQRLGYLTADCPFITVVAGVLIRRGQLHPACADHEDTIRKEVLRTFRDVLVADPITGDSELRRAVLDGIAALQPFRTADPDFQHSLAELIGRPYDRAVRHIHALEDAAALMRRGESLRVVPDLLADVVLSEACFDDASGAPTGYLERVSAAAKGQAALHIFVNAGRIDWQVRHDYPGVPSLTETLWGTIDAATRSAGILGRIGIMKLLQKVSYFEPRRSLQLVRWVIDNPTVQVEDMDEPLLEVHQWSYEDVLSEVPAVVRAIAHNAAYLRESVDLLWTLAATGTRDTNRYREHAVRVLRGLAELGPGKPLEYTDTLIQAAAGWLQSDLAARGPSPFDVLDPVLATEGSEDSSDGSAIHSRPFHVIPSVVQPYRDRVIRLALSEIASTDVRRAARAVKVIGTSLRFPVGLFGRQVPQAEREEWVPSFLKVLTLLKDTISTTTVDPVIAVAIRSGLHWHLEYSDLATRDAARSVLETIPEALPIRTAAALFDGWGHLLQERTPDWREMEARSHAQMNSLAEELIQAYTDDEIVDLITARLSAQQTAFNGRGGNPGRLVWALVTARPAVGLTICSRVAADPQTAVAAVVNFAVACLAEVLPDDAVRAIHQLLATDAPAVRRRIAYSLGRDRGPRSTLLCGELEILLGLIADEDPTVRLSTVRAAQRLASFYEADALALIGNTRFADAPEVADEVFRSFTAEGPLQWRQLPVLEADVMLAQLVTCPSIEEYHIQEFLCGLSKENPEQVVALLMQRVERWEEVGSALEYQPLPYQWTSPLQIRSDPELRKYLRRIRDWLSSKPDSWLRQDAGGRLFAAAAQDFNDPDVMLVLEEALDTCNPDRLVAIASMLRRAPGNVLMSNVVFVSRVLKAASRLGTESVDRVASAIYGAVSSGTFTGVPGPPFARDVEQRDRARVIADGLSRGSVEERFYRSLQKSAEEKIGWQAARDAKLLDSRE
jgi:transcriptional regulator with XRE-family HTH domain